MRFGIALLPATNGTAKNRVDSVNLVRRCLRDSHVIELGTDRVVEFVPEVAPVFIGIGRALDLLSLGHREKLDLLLGRLANDADIVLPKFTCQLNPSKMCSAYNGTYVDNIELDTRLGADAVLVSPAVGEMGHVEHAAELDLALSRHAGDAVLHENCEAGAEKRAAYEAIPELLGEPRRAVVLILGDGPIQKIEELDDGLVDEVARANSNVLRYMPGEEDQDADHALVRPLRTVLGEGVLHAHIVSNREGGKIRPRALIRTGVSACFTSIVNSSAEINCLKNPNL